MSAPVASPSDALLASYDAVPYGGGAIAGTRPDYLAATAKLRGLDTPDVRRCRVLDLGCATGGNLLAMALAFPESSFVGVDLSPRQIAAARSAAREIGVDNVRFESMSITDIDETFGTFDYIVTHGVYSWVPLEVQQKLLEVCSRNLAPDGIAYVSYNTYPGWHLRGLVRDMILFHDRADLSPHERVQRARTFLEKIASSVPKNDSVYSALLREEITLLGSANDSYFMHEELEPENHPVYFVEFMRRAAAAGLQFVTESAPTLTDVQMPNEVKDTFRSWSGDELRYEQYLDFARNRTFRKTLLCHAGRAPTREPIAAALPALYLRARCYADRDAPDAKQPGVEVFRTLEGVAATMSHPVVRAALHVLIDAAPAAVPFATLLEKARARDEVKGIEIAEALLADAMLRCALVRMLDLTIHPECCATRLGERPVASPLARFEARTEPLVTSLLHVEVKLTDFDRYVLTLLDGTRDRAAVVDSISEAAKRGEVDLGQPRPREAIADAVNHAFEQFRVAGLLVG
jgi:SAM-dependent methyltransferase/methyltransferase-like protein